MPRGSGTSSQCLDKIAKVEGGTSGVCNMDGKTDSCGVYQIKETYWKDCGQPGGSWKQCAADNDCARQCITSYTSRYSGQCAADLGKNVNDLTCSDYGRLHNGGPRGCSKEATEKYGDKLKK